MEKGDAAKVNYQNSLDVASLDEFVSEEYVESDDRIAVRLDENENRSFEIVKPGEKQLARQLSQNSEKPIKVYAFLDMRFFLFVSLICLHSSLSSSILKLHKKNLPLKLHSQSIELVSFFLKTRI